MRNFAFFLIFAVIPAVLYGAEAPAEDTFYFFYSDSCPHCHEAMPFIEELEKEYPGMTFKKLEVSGNEVNLALFGKKAEKLGIKGRGVPTFIFKDKYVVGFKKGSFEKKIREMIGKPAPKALPENNKSQKKPEAPAAAK